jgi:hypothetical protein
VVAGRFFCFLAISGLLALTDRLSRQEQIIKIYAELDRLEAEGTTLKDKDKERTILLKFFCHQNLRCDRYPENIIDVPRVSYRIPSQIPSRASDEYAGPKVVLGWAIGYPIARVSERSLMSAMGVHPGDIIVEVEGYSLTRDQEKMTELWNRLRTTSDRISMDVFRGLKLIRLRFFKPRFK